MLALNKNKIVTVGQKIFSIVTVLLITTPVIAQLSINDKTRATVSSPDRNLKVEFYQKQDDEGKRVMYYSVNYKGQSIIKESALDIQLDNHLSESAMALKVDKHKKWCENLAVKKIIPYSKDTSWKPVCGERSEVRDHYNATDIEMVKDDNPIYRMDVQIRA